MNDRIIPRLRAELAFRGLSARQLAARIGVTQSYMAARMSGEVEFRTGDLEKIAEALEIEVHQLLPDVPTRAERIAAGVTAVEKYRAGKPAFADEPTPGGAR